ncbi:MAG TPA: hypothetical protein VF173_06960 [Thermoanaerobaculia bacterium]|nr:hypothetical protein [Thermoanaerobaculia bacterium]
MPIARTRWVFKGEPPKAFKAVAGLVFLNVAAWGVLSPRARIAITVWAALVASGVLAFIVADFAR